MEKMLIVIQLLVSPSAGTKEVQGRSVIVKMDGWKSAKKNVSKVNYT